MTSACVAVRNGIYTDKWVTLLRKYDALAPDATFCFKMQKQTSVIKNQLFSAASWPVKLFCYFVSDQETFNCLCNYYVEFPLNWLLPDVHLV